jgi:MFS transporter, CP family, cyanate transporter
LPSATSSTRRHDLALAAVVVVLALNLRTVFASLPPLLETVRADLDLSATASGLLTTLPVLCLGILAPLAPALGRRIALERVVWLGLAATAGGLAVRGLDAVVPLFLGTLLAGAGVALAQVALPVLIRLRFPDRTGLLMGAFSMGLPISATLAAALSVPLERALGGWPAALAVWAVPAALVTLLWTLPAARARPHPVDEHPHRPWRAPIGWWIGAFFGVQSAAFYATLAWLPTMLQDRGFGEREAGLLLALASFVSFVPAFLVPVLAARRRDQRGLLLVTVAVPVVGLVGLAAAPDAAAGWVLLIGAGQGAALGLGLILPALRAADPRLVGPLIAMSQCIGYTAAATGPWLIGLVHDLSGDWTAPLYALLAITALELPVGLVGARGARPPTVRSPVERDGDLRVGAEAGRGLRDHEPAVGADHRPDQR